MKYWKIIADKLSAAGWSWGYCSAVKLPAVGVGVLADSKTYWDQSPIYGCRRMSVKVP